MFIAALLIVAKTRKQTKCLPVDVWTEKRQCIYTMGYYSAIEKMEILPLVTARIYFEDITLSEINHRKTNTV